WCAPWTRRDLADAQDLPGGRCTRTDQGTATSGTAAAPRAQDEHPGGRAAALGLKRRLVEDIDGFFGSYDVLLASAAFGPAFKRCKVGSPLDFDGARRPYHEYCGPYVEPFNASGHPALVMPLGTSNDGPPLRVT